MHLDANLVMRRLWRKRRFINRRPEYPEKEIVNLLPSGTRHLEVGHRARHVLAGTEGNPWIFQRGVLSVPFALGNVVPMLRTPDFAYRHEVSHLFQSSRMLTM